VDVRAFVGSIVGSLRPGPSPLAVAAAVRAVVAALVIAGFGVLRGDLQAVSVAYLGAACAVAFVGAGPYRTRAIGLATQAAGAAVGIAAGAALPSSATVMIVTAWMAGALSGAVGTLGFAAPGFGMMLSIGVAFGQFGGSTLPWWQQSAWYLLGTAVVAAATLAPWAFHRGAFERAASAAVLDAAADLCSVVATDDGRAARVRLAAASAAARAAGTQPLVELVAFAAAAMYSEGEEVPAEAVTAIRSAAYQVRSGEAISVHYAAPADTPGLAALADALSPVPQRPAASYERRFGAAVRSVLTRVAAVNAARIGLCMGVATTLTLLLHEPAHSFWLPLTVAVIVRPEYASVFVRTVNRVCGTVVGAAVTALVLAAHPPEVVLAACAAAALGFAVLAAPKLYALNVIGVTASALLSSSLAAVDVVLPGLRLLDTVLGAVVAVVFGYLLWPGARRLPSVARLEAAVTAASAYLTEAVKAPQTRTRWQVRRDDAYRLAHQARAAVQAAVLEPPPVSVLAFAALPVTAELEDVVDAITAVAAARDLGDVGAEWVSAIETKLSALETLGAGR
jgi:hypothetical protein